MTSVSTSHIHLTADQSPVATQRDLEVNSATLAGSSGQKRKKISNVTSMATPRSTTFADLRGPAANPVQTPSPLSLVSSNSDASTQGEAKRKKTVEILKSSSTSADSGLNSQTSASPVSQKGPTSSGGYSWSSLLSYFMGSKNKSDNLPAPTAVQSAISPSAAVQGKSEPKISKPAPLKEPHESKISKQIKMNTNPSSVIDLTADQRPVATKKDVIDLTADQRPVAAKKDVIDLTADQRPVATKKDVIDLTADQRPVATQKDVIDLTADQSPGNAV